MLSFLKRVLKFVSRVIFVILIWIAVVGTSMVLIYFNAIVNPNQTIMLQQSSDNGGMFIPHGGGGGSA